jgi:hypothetical protein
VDVDGLRRLHSERIKEVQSENPDLALVLPALALTASFEVGERFLAAVDPMLEEWSVCLGDLLRGKQNKRILRALDLRDNTEWIRGTYLLRGEPVAYKELEHSICSPG